MDDKYLDTLISKAYEEDYLEAMPTEEFFLSIANRGVRHRHYQLFMRVAAIVGLVIMVAGGVFYFSLREDRPEEQSLAQNAIYLENEMLMERRFESLGATQRELRISIENEFPTLYTTER